MGYQGYWGDKKRMQALQVSLKFEVEKARDCVLNFAR
ncbi:MAG: hypothetical protein ACJAS0_000628 [Alcanivorax borkumensis]|jgi:hypothetical protein